MLYKDNFVGANSDLGGAERSAHKLSHLKETTFINMATFWQEHNNDNNYRQTQTNVGKDIV